MVNLVFYLFSSIRLINSIKYEHSGSKDQELVQSSTTPDPEYDMGKEQN